MTQALSLSESDALELVAAEVESAAAPCVTSSFRPSVSCWSTCFNRCARGSRSCSWTPCIISADARLSRRDRQQVGTEPDHASRRRTGASVSGSRTSRLLRQAQSAAAVRRARAPRYLVHRTSPRPVPDPRDARAHRVVHAPDRQGASQGQPAGALAHEGRSGRTPRRIRSLSCRSTNWATPASAASRARRSRWTRPTIAQVVGVDRNWSAAFTWRG